MPGRRFNLASLVPLGLTIVSLFVLGCRLEPDVQPELAEPAGSDPYSPTLDALEQRAVELASRDLERLNAAEMVYRNRVFAHQLVTGDRVLFAHVKLYRHFTGYSVVDIRSSDSLRHPYAVDVEFSFDYVGTEAATSRGPFPNVGDHPEEDFDFRVLDSDLWRWSYLLDQSGNETNHPPYMLDRPIYWDVTGHSRAGAASIFSMNP